MAKENETLLAGWASDTEDLEHLDTLLDGQTHRLALNATIREGGARAGRGDGRHFGATSSTRASRSVGRGGGVMGTRGRGTTQGSMASSNSTLGPYRVVLPPTRSHLDPALDNSNDFYRVTREGNASKKEEAVKGHQKQLHVRKPTPAIRARRPMVDYGRLISPPESFLAAARNVVSTTTAGVAPTGAAEAFDDNRPQVSTEPCDTAGASDHPSPSKVLERLGYQIPARPQAATRSEDPFTTQRASSQRQDIAREHEPLPLRLSPTVQVTASQEERSPLMSLKTEESVSELLKSQTQVKEQVTSGISTPKKIEKLSPGENPAIGDEGSRSIAASSATDALLLDISLTPPKQMPLGQSPFSSAMLSPTLEDLKGLTFEDLEPLQDPVSHDSAPRNQPGESKSAYNLQRQIDILCELLESTSLSDVSRENLKQCKDELQGKMSKHSPTDETKGKRVLFPGEHIPQGLKTVAEPGDQSSLDLLDMQDTPMESVRLDTTQSLSPQSRLNVTAPPFFPLMPYRSPSGSLSSESTCIPQTPCPHRRVAEGHHIIGDHLLPGRHSNSMVTGPDPLVAKQLQPGIHPEPRVKFSIPQQPSLTLAPKPPVMEAFRSDDAVENIQPRTNPSPELQRSIHAPSPKPLPRPLPKPKALGGLESSRYANPSSNKPFR
ncbi:uncharacterized protein BO80DRAFT_460850 [Aspergillus ibericus CBS 121593]|uniref:Uncharacterized protein n=1 Tax=Aspergillus ibericus CBS 121593 TaxID=1448316 RepID=A0A395HE57_9EURO|nr:hypothetical protein BO80DRAFT_460850 [Aspergillus ibericus CBS 121593]RAL05789.1 hypothetical protein BO80DRAFT_460850 [Aspergillus ibericus CBS 121593]